MIMETSGCAWGAIRRRAVAALAVRRHMSVWLDRVVLVCVMGAAGSGKSTLAKQLEKMRPDDVARVPVAFFFVPRRLQESVADYLSRPFRYDWTALDRAITATGPQRSAPDCDFTTFQWRFPYGGLCIGKGSNLILDGMRPHPKCELLVLLEIDTETQQRRLVERDQRWNTSVAERTRHLSATFAAGVAEMPRPPDLVLPATDPVQRNAAAVLELIAQSRVD